MYTDAEEVPLSEVLEAVKKKENGAVALSLIHILMTPDINVPFTEGDVVWVVGEREDVYRLLGKKEKEEEYDIRAEMNVFEKKFGKLYELKCLETAEKVSGDKEVILEVIENLLSNAFRYAKTKVEMEVFLTCSELQLSLIHI